MILIMVKCSILVDAKAVTKPPHSQIYFVSSYKITIIMHFTLIQLRFLMLSVFHNKQAAGLSIMVITLKSINRMLESTC